MGHCSVVSQMFSIFIFFLSVLASSLLQVNTNHHFGVMVSSYDIKPLTILKSKCYLKLHFSKIYLKKFDSAGANGKSRVDSSVKSNIMSEKQEEPDEFFVHWEQRTCALAIEPSSRCSI